MSREIIDVLVVRHFKRIQKGGCLLGFVSIETPSGLIIHDCRLFEKNGRRWIGLPSRQYKREDGGVAYAQIVEFTSKQVHDRFQAEALQAVERFERGEGK